MIEDNIRDAVEDVVIDPEALVIIILALAARIERLESRGGGV